MNELLDQLRTIDEAQLTCVAQWHDKEPETLPEGFAGLVAEQSLQNFRLWHKEDIARIPDTGDDIIAGVKRNIDKLNQRRNDLIEKLDEFLLIWLDRAGIKMNPNAALNSETPGSMIDRCSIMALKIYHMQEETMRDSADEEHKTKAIDRLETLRLQRADMIDCLCNIFKEIEKGTRQFKIYRQFKMYNDPNFNPQLYKKKE
jgi:hypothetical protein